MNNRADQLLDLYFSRTISSEEETELRQLLATDRTLAHEFSWQIQLARKANFAGNHHPPKERLRSEEEQLKNLPGSGKMRFLYRTAAAILLLGAAMWLLKPYFFTSKAVVSDPVAIAMDNFEHYPNKITIRVAGSTQDDSIPLAVRDALKVYDNKDYLQAAEAFRTIVENYPNEISYRFYYGVSLVGCKQFVAAIPPLEQTTQQDNIFKTPALFYLALANTGARRFPQARQALNNYLEDANGVPYRKKAVALLKELPEAR